MPESKLKIELAGNFSESLKELYRLLTQVDERLEKTAKAFNQFERTVVQDSKSIADAVGKLEDEIAKTQKTLETSGQKGAATFADKLKSGFQSVKGIAQQAAGLVEQGFNAGMQAINAARIGAEFGKKFLDGVASQLKNLGSTIQSAGQNLIGSGTRLAVAGGLAGLLGSAAVGEAATFEQTLRQVQVFGNLTQEALSGVQDQILQFSAETIFDPTQSINAFLELQKAGLNAADALTALDRVGELAAAGNQTLAEAQQGVVLAAQSFSIAYSDATRITDAYVQAANSGTASVSELEQGVANVGISAKNFGLSFEETVAVLSLFNDAGIRGAEAGTQLKTILTRLSSDNKEVTNTFRDLGISITDSAGNLRSLDAILNDLRHRMNDVRTVTVQVTKGLGEEQKNALELAEKAYASATRKIQLFELGLSSSSEASIANAREIQNNASGVIASVTGSNEVLRTFQTEVQNSQIENVRILQQLGGTFGQLGLATLIEEDENAIANFVTEMQKLPSAATISTQLMDTFKGSLDSLKGSFQTLLIKGLIPVMQKGLQPMIETAVKIVNGMAGLPEPILAGAAAFVVMGTAIVTLTGVGLILLGTVMQPLGFAIGILGTAVAGLSTLLFNPFGLIAAFGALSAAALILIPLLGVMGAGLIAAVQIFNDIRNNVDGSRDSLERLIGSIQNLISSAAGLGVDILGLFTGIGDASSDAQTNLQPIVNLFDTIREKVDSVVQGINDLRTFLQLIGAIRAEPTFDTAAANQQLDTLLAKRDQLTKDIVGGTGGGAQTVTVQPGQSFASIAGGAGLSIEELIALNPQLGGVRPKVKPGDVFTVGMDVDATPALAELEAVNQEIENIQTKLEVSASDEAFIQKRSELEAEIARNKKFSAMFSEEDQAALQESTAALQEQLDALNEMGQAEVIDLFTELEGSPLFDRLFGTEANLQAVREAVAAIDANFATIKDNIGVVADGFITLAGGDIQTGITNISLGLITIADKAEDIFEQVTGVDVGTPLNDLLAPLTDFLNDVNEALVVFAPLQPSFEALIEDIQGLPAQLSANLSERDAENLNKVLDFIKGIAEQAAIFGGATLFVSLAGGLIVLRAAIDSIEPLMDVAFGLLDLIISLSELDGEGIKGALDRIAEGIAGLFEALILEPSESILEIILGEDQVNIEEKLAPYAMIPTVIEAIFLKLVRAAIEARITFTEAINGILEGLQSLLDLGDEALKALGLEDLANIEVGTITPTFGGLEATTALDVNTIKQQLLGGAGAEDIIELGIKGEVSFESIEIAAESDESLQAALDQHTFKTTLKDAEVTLANPVITQENGAEIAASISDQLASLSEQGLLTPELALQGLNLKETLQAQLGEAPTLTGAELDLVSAFGLDKLAAPGSALDQAIKASGDQMVKGLDAGIQESEVDPAQNLADTFQDTFNGAMLIESPSGWMFERGLDLMQGLADGMAEGMPLIQAQVDAIITELMRIDMAIQELARRSQQAFFIIGIGMMNAAILFTLGVNQMIAAINVVHSKFKDLLWTLQNINAQLEGIAFNIENLPGLGGAGTLPGVQTAQAGGIRQGLTLVGEAGRELVTSDTRFAVLNNRSTEAFLAGLNFFPQQPQPAALGTGGGFSYSDNRTIVVDARGSNLTEAQIVNAVGEALRLADERTMSFEKRAIVAGLL